MYYDESDFYFSCGMIAFISLLLIGPAIGSIVAYRDNEATIEVCKELCVTYDKRPQCLACCELNDWRYEDEKKCH